MRYFYLSVFLFLITFTLAYAQAPNISYQTPQVYTATVSISPLTPANSGGAVPATIYGQVSTFAGSGAQGQTNGTGMGASFNSPTRSVFDNNGNLYVADRDNNLIRKITPAGVVTTLASGFNQPNGVTVDAAGNVFVADAASNTIKMVTPAGIVTVFAGGTQGNADGTRTNASFYYPFGISIDATGNFYVADTYNNLVRKITSTGVVTTLAGTGATGANNGTAIMATFNHNNYAITDAAGNVYVADPGNYIVRKISGGVVSTFAGTGVSGSLNGTTANATFAGPCGVAIDDLSGYKYIADLGNNLIRKIDPLGNVSTLAGSGAAGSNNGIGSLAAFDRPNDVQLSSGYLYVTDVLNNQIRKIILTGYTIDKTLPAGLNFDVTTGIISGTPSAKSPSTNYTITAYNIYGSSTFTVNITVNALQVLPPNISYQTPQVYNVNTTITALTPNNTGGPIPATIYGKVSTYAGSGFVGSANGVGTNASFQNPYSATFDASGNLFIADCNNQLIRKITTPTAAIVTTFAGNGNVGSTNGTGIGASFNNPGGVTTDVAGNVYVGDQTNNLIRKITPAGVVTTFAGNTAGGFANGTNTSATFLGPAGLIFDSFGNLYVADRRNNVVRKITPAGVVSTFAGNGSVGFANGTGTAASFNNPTSMAVDAFDNVYVADQYNNLIRKITQAGIVTTFAGSGAQGSTNGAAASAGFNKPFSLSFDISGNLYLADEFNNLIRQVTPSGVVTTLAGNGSAGGADGVGSSASFNYPAGVIPDGLGNLYVTETGGQRIRKIIITGYVIDKQLPAGLVFDQTIGVISGTPTALSPATDYLITAYNTGGSSSTTVNIKVVAQVVVPPNISYQTPQVYKINTVIPTLAPTNTGGAVTVTAQVSTFAGGRAPVTYDSQGADAGFNLPSGITADVKGNIYVSDYGSGAIRKITPSAVVTTIGNVNTPSGLVIDNQGNLFVTSFQNNYIYKITAAGVKTIFAGSGSVGAANGMGTAASFNGPGGITIDNLGNLLLADQGNNMIRKITSSGVVTTLAGNGLAGSTNGAGAQASFNNPDGLCIDSFGNVYVADTKNNLVRKISTTGIVSTFAGNGIAGNSNGTSTTASFNYPTCLNIDVNNNVYVVDYKNNEIRVITTGGAVTTIAGNGAGGNLNGPGNIATFNSPLSAVFDLSGNLYITDFGNYVIRKVTFTACTIDKALPAGLVFNTLTGNITGTPTVVSPATNYTVTASNAGGTSSTVVNISVYAENQVILTAFPLKSTCDIDFDAGATGDSSAITYISSNNAVATILSGKIHIVGAGTTIITATDGITSAQQTLAVKAPVTPAVIITPDNTTVCAGASVNFTATITNKVNNVNYQWQVNGVNVGTNSNVYSVTNITITDIIQCIVSRTDSCLISGSSNLYTGIINNPYVTPSVVIKSNPSESVCPGSKITFTATATNGGTAPVYQWQVNGIINGINGDTFTSNTLVGNDLVTCILTNTTNKCITAVSAISNTIPVDIITTQSPMVTVTPSANNVYGGTAIIFTANVSNAPAISGYQWKVNGIDTGPNNISFTTSSLRDNDTVTCTVTFATGCILTVTSKAVAIKIFAPPDLFIPNTFTPNGDSVNDTWEIKNLNYFYRDCTVKIYNRNGSLLFTSNGYAFPWDGVYNGTVLPIGTYYYIINLDKTNTKRLSGSLNLLR